MFSYQSQRSRAANVCALCLALAGSVVFLCGPERACAVPITISSPSGDLALRSFASTFFSETGVQEVGGGPLLDIPFDLPFSVSNDLPAQTSHSSATFTSTFHSSMDSSAESLSMNWSRNGTVSGSRTSTILSGAEILSVLGYSFTLAEPARYSWNAIRYTAVLPASGFVLLKKLFDDGQDVFRSAFGGDFSGILQPGTYYFTENTKVGLDLNQGNSATFDVETHFSVSTGFHWNNAAGGDFSVASNWFENQVPGAADRAVFDIPGDYTVLFTGDTSSDKVKIQDSVVEFKLDGFGGAHGHKYTLLGAIDGKSLVIGDSGSLNFTSLQLSGGTGSELKAVGDVSIGYGGLAVDSGTTLSVGGNLQSGLDSTGAMYSDESYVAVTGKTQLGVNAGADGTIELDHGSRFTKGLLEIGVLGIGQVYVATGSQLAADEVRFGFASTGNSKLIISDAGTEVDVHHALEVAPNLGHGTVKVLDGAKLTVDSATIGHVDAVSVANVEVQNASWIVNHDLTVAGGAGRATVKVSDKSNINVHGSLQVGSAANGGDGRLDVIDSLLLISGQLIVRGGSSSNLVIVAQGGSIGCGDVFLGGPFLQSSGGVLSLNQGTSIFTPTVHVGAGGWLRGKGKVLGNVLHDGGEVDPGFSPGVLTIDGDYTEVGDGGMLLAEVGGTVLGDEYDQLNVTGNVTLAGTLVVRFIDGFAPRDGDEFAFLHVGGTLTGAYAHIEIENLEPGFRYDLTASEGGLSLHALNDGVFVAVPEPTTLVLLLVGMLTICSWRRAAVS